MAASTGGLNDHDVQENCEVEGDLLDSVVELLCDDSNATEEHDIDIEEVSVSVGGNECP